MQELSPQPGTIESFHPSSSNSISKDAENACSECASTGSPRRHTMLEQLEDGFLREAREEIADLKETEKVIKRRFHDKVGRHIVGKDAQRSRKEFWKRLRGKTHEHVSWATSAKNALTSSWLNVLLLFIPVAWVGHFTQGHEHPWPSWVVFALCFLSIIPMERIFDYGGEQMQFFLGKELGELLIVTLNNTVEAALAIILLTHCELRLLQATVAGVVILHLLLVPGTAFLTGGARIWEQNLHPYRTELNHTLLAVGVLSLLVPAAFFAALQRGAQPDTELLTDALRLDFLQMSRGLAIMLLLIYVASRIFLYVPPPRQEEAPNALTPHLPAGYDEEEHHFAHGHPELNPGFCILMLLITIGLLAATAEWFVESIEFVREESGIQEEWFGLILLPFVSFSADGTVALVYFIQAALFLEPKPPTDLAKGRAIDLSIQFTLFWMPFLVLLSWWIDKPLILLFDIYEVAVLLGACFLVNYVTADAKTNWVEGFILVAFYFMIALCSWFFTGQAEIGDLLECQSVASALIGGGAGE